MIRKRYSAPTFFMLFESNSLRKIQGSFIFINHGLCQPCYSLTIWPKISRAFCFCASCRSDRVLSMLFNSCLDALAHSVTEVVGFSFLSSNVLKNLANCCCHFVRKKPELDLVDSNSVRNHTSDYQTRTNAQRESHLSIITMILDRIRRNEVLLPNTHSYYNFFLFSLFYIIF